MITSPPFTADQWQQHATKAGLADKLSNLAESAGDLLQLVQAVPNTLDELARWAKDWGPLTVEVAKWYAVAASADQHTCKAVMQYLYGLMRIGSYPCTVRPPHHDPEVGDGKLLALIAYRDWEEQGYPHLPDAIYHAQQQLKSEVMAAHMRNDGGEHASGYIGEMDRFNATPPNPPRIMSMDEIRLH